MGFLAWLSLALIFTFNQFYTPIHLASHEHTDAFGVERGGWLDAKHVDGCCESAAAPKGDQDEDGHETHAESDHLFGFLAGPAATSNIVVTLSPCGTLFHDVAFVPYSISWNVPHNRGPPAVA